MIFRMLQKPIFKPTMISSQRNLFTSTVANQNHDDHAGAAIDQEAEEDENQEVDSEEDFIERYLDPKDRSRVIPPETSIKYLGTSW